MGAILGRPKKPETPPPPPDDISSESECSSSSEEEEVVEEAANEAAWETMEDIWEVYARPILPGGSQ